MLSVLPCYFIQVSVNSFFSLGAFILLYFIGLLILFVIILFTDKISGKTLVHLKYSAMCICKIKKIQKLNQYLLFLKIQYLMGFVIYFVANTKCFM